MRLEKLYIKGFRNFKESIVNFNNHSLIIGANDVGKTNLLYAIRILMDKGFSDYDFDLKESDYHVYSENKVIVIRIYLCEIVEDCAVSKLGGKLSDDGKSVIEYRSTFANGKSDYKFSMGKSDAELSEIDGPVYRKYINVKYIGSKREFWSYINKVKTQLLNDAKESRDENAVHQDDNIYAEIEQKLKEVDEKIPSLSYVEKATNEINDELKKLSAHNSEQQIIFDVSSSDLDRMIRNVSLTAKYGDKKLLIGGEGRINQIYLSLWASQNKISDISTEISILCIEEPEAYLHPHQQRELASYLNNIQNGQIVLTTHSPYIVSEFSPNSIIRLYKDSKNSTEVASNGCSKIIGDNIEDFGYRMSVIPAEAFFADHVILVEGQSEMIFYKTLAKQLDINLDRLNISILSVEGVGFDTYALVLDSMNIEWTMRTDNDVFKIPKKTTFRFAGIERGLDIIDKYELEKEVKEKISQLKPLIHGFTDKDNLSDNIKKAAKELKDILEKERILLAEEGLEEDLFNSPLKQDLKDFYGNDKSDDDVIKAMKNKKAISMYDFLKQKKDSLKKLKTHSLAKPLILAQENIELLYGAY